MPYVLPTLKSVEYIDQRPKDLQPLVINMHGGQASIDTNPDGSTHIELEDGNVKDLKEINDTINSKGSKIQDVTTILEEGESKDHKSKFNHLISHKTEQGELNGDPEVPQVFMKQTTEKDAVIFENEGDLQAILNDVNSFENRKKRDKKK